MTRDWDCGPRRWSTIRRFFWPDQTDDGFGQSMMDDLSDLVRFRAYRRQTVAWRLPTREEGIRLALAELTPGCGVHPRTAANLADLVRLMSCDYRNLIEGHGTRPREIERARSGDLNAGRQP
jgi:hypothetical protein